MYPVLDFSPRTAAASLGSELIFLNLGASRIHGFVTFSSCSVTKIQHVLHEYIMQPSESPSGNKETHQQRLTNTDVVFGLPAVT